MSEIVVVRVLTSLTTYLATCFSGTSALVALPLTGGRVCVLSHRQGGKLSDGVVPAIHAAGNVTDFCFDPFDACLLYVACDDGKLQVIRPLDV